MQEEISSEFMDYFSKMSNLGICSTTGTGLNPDNVGREDLSGGVTQLVTYFVVTSDIK